jgi:hypothetical protein
MPHSAHTCTHRTGSRPDTVIWQPLLRRRRVLVSARLRRLFRREERAKTGNFPAISRRWQRDGWISAATPSAQTTHVALAAAPWSA